ncbi:MAG: succinylglutamate desuccinylase/aspartoacylase family protein [Alphaproteobacteria bacterium]|nr:succinylglutamate desuccinylase/aspartoacylase family protein [Alphaproteobacteria bacterium]MCW5741085.1 succinylglutamate desuccinylase/aspartoacylase family protein [Alphaproteobacteria bacterium]
MPRTIERIALPSPSPGTERHIVVHRFGRRDARPRVWLQAAIHADELPGPLVLHHLMPLLVQADREGLIPGEIMVAPLANPVGLSQVVGSVLQGRYALDGSGNFNRGFVDLRDALEAAMAGKLGDEPAANVAAIRAAIETLLAGQKADDESAILKLTLHRLAATADIALDLHCDDQAGLHIYCGPRQAAAFADLAARLGAVALLTAEDSGDTPFDEALTRPWWRLMQRHQDKPIPAEAMISCTVELRGRGDIDDAMARRDAQGIFDWLCARGAVSGEAPPAPASCPATPLDGVGPVRTPHAGLWVPCVEPGTRVAAGDVVGHLVDPMLPADAGRLALKAPVAGIMFARMRPDLAKAGDRVAKIASPESIPDRRGKLLGDR